MAGLYSIFESNADIKNYILGISKSMNIENCKVLVNTYTSSKYTINSLKQYCKENGIPYFERGEFDIFSLEEIEFIYECLNSNNEIKEVFEEFRNKYPKSHIDLTEKEFEYLNNKPGIHSKRYFGNILFKYKLQRFLEMMKPLIQLEWYKITPKVK